MIADCGFDRRVHPRKFVLLNDPYNQPDEGAFMQFRLTYEGLLLATQRDPLTGQQDRRADHKHDIRKIFHQQMKLLWEITPLLKRGTGGGEKYAEEVYLASEDCSMNYKTRHARQALL